MSARYSAKKPVNLSVREDLVKEARRKGLNLSRLLEEALDRTLQADRAQRWAEENREAIDAYNQRVRRRGVFGDSPERGF